MHIDDSTKQAVWYSVYMEHAHTHHCCFIAHKLALFNGGIYMQEEYTCSMQYYDCGIHSGSSQFMNNYVVNSSSISRAQSKLVKL